RRMFVVARGLSASVLRIGRRKHRNTRKKFQQSPIIQRSQVGQVSNVFLGGPSAVLAVTKMFVRYVSNKILSPGRSTSQAFQDHGKQPGFQIERESSTDPGNGVQCRFLRRRSWICR